jgi:hypothetical protein
VPSSPGGALLTAGLVGWLLRTVPPGPPVLSSVSSSVSTNGIVVPAGDSTSG